MNANPHREEELFSNALALPLAEREIYLEQACGGDAELLRRVQALLRKHASMGDFLEAPAAVVGLLDLNHATEPLSFREVITGAMIGRYKLLQRIGEGGCGVVYMAEQEEPIRRRVALKVIKLGMDTKDVIARFESERQALALLDHPNVARVLDAGATESGRPYFVMELVRGVKITTFCDEHNLSTSERLHLFTQVCHAIQHAHQKGIIHRDIKPSNILVTLQDGAPMPKVIDFGIAKATQGRLTDQTVFTAYEQFIGTPAYMSPEQAEMSSQDVDTRSDIYSLGVLLYELLTGVTPFDAETLRRAALDEIRRMIRQEEPSKPSTRLDTLGVRLNDVARFRHTEPKALRRLIRGDLDWIVMKALEKDRRRRYETPDALANDVARHLSNEPVRASSPSVPYLAGKFARRHKTGLAVTAMLLALLLVGSAVSIWQAVRATQAERAQSLLRQQAEQARANERQLRLQAEAREKVAQADVLVRAGSPEEADKMMRTISPLLDEMNASTAAAIYFSLGDWHARRGEWQEAAANDLKAIAAQSGYFEAYNSLAPVLVQSGDRAAFEQLRRQMLSRFGETTDPAIAGRVVMDCLILPWSGLELQQVRKIADEALKASSNHWALSYIQLAKALAAYRQGDFAGAVESLQAPLQDQGKDLARDVEAYMVLAMARHQQGYSGYARDALTTGLGLAARLPSSERDLQDWKAWNDWVIAQTLMREGKDLLNLPTTSMKVSGAELRTDE